MTPALLRGGAGPHSPVLSLIVQREMGRAGAGWGGLVGGERGFKPIFRGMGKLWRMVSTPAQAAAGDN